MTIPTLITDICTAIVGKHFRMGVYESDDTLLLELFAGPDAIAHLIGRKGQLVQALRDIAGAAGHQEGRRVYVRVWEEWT